MTYHFVTESEPYWILGNICKSLSKYLSASISSNIDNTKDVNIFVNYCVNMDGFDQCTSKRLCLFTHRETDVKSDEWDYTARECDYCLCQSSQWLSYLPNEKTTLFNIGLDDIFYKNSDKLTIGVIGREYDYTDRKNYSLLKEIKKINGVKIKFSGGRLSLNELDQLYNDVDIILVTSKIEGGPMCIKEAIAKRKIVISSPVGYALEYPCITYNTQQELLNIIKSYIIHGNEWLHSAIMIKEITQKIKYD